MEICLKLALGKSNAKPVEDVPSTKQLGGFTLWEEGQCWLK